jgi:hypothetical protein
MNLRNLLRTPEDIFRLNWVKPFHLKFDLIICIIWIQKSITRKFRGKFVHFLCVSLLLGNTSHGDLSYLFVANLEIVAKLRVRSVQNWSERSVCDQRSKLR